MDQTSKNLSPFIKARLILTFWYMVGLIFIIVFFTWQVFQAKESAFIRVYRVLEVQTPTGSPQLQEFSDTFAGFNAKFRQRVISTDIGLIFFALVLAFYLSGKTLDPIQQMLKERESFAGDVSHSLRTPLSTMLLEIDSYLHVQKVKSGDLFDMLVSLKEEINHMKQIIEGLLVLVRIKSESNVELKEINLSELVRLSVKTFTPMTKSKNLQLIIKVKNNIKTKIDKDQFKQVFAILIDNAIKYTPSKGTITVWLTNDKSKIQLKIIDTGIGIPTEELHQIFDRYYRSTRKSVQSIQGTGLGLTIAKALVDTWGGNITAKSSSKGSVFEVIF